MVTFITVVHIILALLIVLITFFQDSKSDSLGGAFGGGGSNSLFGAVGATTFIQKLTWWLAGFFAVTSIALAHFSARPSKSVLDSVALPPAQSVPTTSPSTETPSDSAAPEAGASSDESASSSKQ